MNRKATSPTSIKSAERVFAIMEYLNSYRLDASLSDISRALGYPVSSTYELLHCMCDMGYLELNRDTRLYRLTARVAALGSSVLPDIFRRGNILALMDRINEATDESVALGLRLGIAVQFIHLLPPRKRDRTIVPLTYHSPLTRSAIGRMILSHMPDREVELVVRRLNSELEAPMRQPYRTLADELATIRGQGYSVTMGEYIEGKGMVAVLLPGTADTMAVGIGAPVDVIARQQQHFVDLLRDIIPRFPVDMVRKDDRPDA